MEIRNWKSGLIIGALLLVQSAGAVEFVQRDQFISTEGEILREEIWVSAQSVRFDGEASNDLFAIASTIDLNGIFRDDLRLVSRTAQVSGTLYGSLIAIGSTVKIDRTAVLYEDIVGLGEHVILEGSVSGNARIMAQRVTLGGKIDGDISIVAQDIVVLPGTILNGNLTYTAPKELILPPTVMLGGELTRKFEAIPEKQIFKPNLIGHFFFGLAALVTGLVFIGLFPRYTGGTFMALQNARGLSMLIGFISLVMLPVSAFLLLFTVIGLPLSMLLFLFYFILLYLSKIVVAIALGSALLRRKEFNKRTAAGPLALGLLIIYALTSIVAASMLINILIVIMGLGALLLALFKKPVLVIQTSDTVN